GKQVTNPANIYYTPSSGIWQTVWLEQVPENYIESLVITPDIDNRRVSIIVKSQTAASVSVQTAGVTVKGKANQPILVPVKELRLWSPSDPHLYDLLVKMGSDEVKSYFGMRKVSLIKDAQGNDRIALN